MNKGMQVIIGVGLIVASGILFTIERLSSYIYWLALALHNQYQPEPKIFYFQNWFVWIFLGVGLLILMYAFSKEINRIFFT